MFPIKNQTIEQGYVQYEGKAIEHINNPKRLVSLLSKTVLKANNKKGVLSEVWDKLHLLIELVKSWSKGEYRDISSKTMITIVATLLYFVSPIDLVPDFLVGLGILDDAAVIGYTVKQISKELDLFKAWKQTFK
jgi:uncharacterized membrane protein YkvA (DUF1232 family)